MLLLSIAVFPGLFSGADPRDGDLTHHFLTKPELSHFFRADWFGYDGQGRSSAPGSSPAPAPPSWSASG